MVDTNDQRTTTFATLVRGSAWRNRTRRSAQNACTTAALLGTLTFLVAVAVSHAQQMDKRQFCVLGMPDPSIIQADDGGGYFIFSTGRGISIWHSRDLVNWTSAGRVFAERKRDDFES